MWSGRYQTRTCTALVALVFLFSSAPALAAPDQYGQITFNDLPIPGATITATQGDKKIVVASDADGRYRLVGLSDGAYSIRIEMLGFTPVTHELVASEQSALPRFELTLLPFDEIRKVSAVSRPTIAVEGPLAGETRSSELPPVDPELERQAAEGLLVNGSVNNAAASPFAQARAFGNNRPGQRSLYNGGFGFTLGTSAFDARPFSFAVERTPKPDYADLHLVASFGGPFRIPGVRNRPVFFAGYQRTSDHNAATQSAVMPTRQERGGDFSGRGQIIDPQSGRPFPGNVIPSSRISPQAAALAEYYPLPNVADDRGYNYQATTVSTISQDSFQSRVNHSINNRNSLLGTTSYQRTNTDTASIFRFVDSTTVASLDTSLIWSHRFSQFLTFRLGYQFLRQTNDSTPHFSNRANVSSAAGIAGNDQDPVNWGPPTLVFSSGIAALGTGQYARQDSRIHSYSAETLWRTRGGHAFTFGGSARPQRVDVVAQQNARGTFGFNGSVTGSDLADFLLGIPHSIAIGFGNADKSLGGRTLNAYVTDDWRMNPAITLNVGARWEYESPFMESRGRLVNLAVTPGFSSATPVVGATLHPDRSGIQPRLGIALRPVAGSSLVIRGGYGIYRNTGVYQSIALMLSEQPPLSKTLSIENSREDPLTLANGFSAPGKPLANTFAVDPNFQVSYAHNWQVSIQRDFPASLTITGTYLGTRGRNLMQEFVPNTYPVGAINPCPACPSGFVYLTSSGVSLKNALQLQVRRRLRNGLTAVTQYTLAKATDDAAAFTTADLTGAVVAQDWRDLEAERALSSFDQRHLLTAQIEYSGRSFLQNWTFTGQLSAGSGFPFTPVFLEALPGTGLVGMLRGRQTGAPLEAAPGGFYANPAAFGPPTAGEWGNAARNSITGPPQFSLNMGVTRTFLIGNRWSMDWRVDATNVLNRVTYSSLNTTVGSQQFGLPNRANPMRKLLSSLRMRF